METTELQSITETKLRRIAYLSTRDKGMKFCSLMHHFNTEALIECFNMLDGKKAVGVDGITKQRYGENHQTNIAELVERLKRMAYRPGPVRQVMIPKEGKPGATRPLGISNLEDKIIQKMTQRILESIYEPLFLENSYGFRPGRGCHDAVKALFNYLYKNTVSVVIDVDLKNFFGTIDHKILENFLREKITDERFIRYIIRMFKAGILTKGELLISEEGVPQGSVCSPVLANVFAHYVIDRWIEEMVKPNCKGKVEFFRYADDLVICCQFENDAQRVKEALGNRLTKYNLELNQEKTKLVPFSKREVGQGVHQGAFDFLGFTFYLGKTRKGFITPKLKSATKRIRAKLQRVTAWLKEERGKIPLKQLWRRFCSGIRGHIQYYGVSHNFRHVSIFVDQAIKIAFKWINRRSQRRSMTWEKFNLFMEANPLPKVVIHHRFF